MATFQVFFCINRSNESVSSVAPVTLEREEILQLTERVLTEEDNFIGVIDAQGAILQLSVEEDRLVAELHPPDQKQYLSQDYARNALAELLLRLPVSFSDRMLPEGIWQED